MVMFHRFLYVYQRVSDRNPGGNPTGSECVEVIQESMSRRPRPNKKMLFRMLKGCVKPHKKTTQVSNWSINENITHVQIATC